MGHATLNGKGTSCRELNADHSGFIKEFHFSHFKEAKKGSPRIVQLLKIVFTDPGFSPFRIYP